MFWKLFCASFHCVGVSWACFRVCVRFIIARFCSFRKVVWRFCRLVEGIGYVIRGLAGGVCISLVMILLGGSWSSTG